MKLSEISAYKVNNTESAYYIKDFINQESEAALLDCIFKLD